MELHPRSEASCRLDESNSSGAPSLIVIRPRGIVCGEIPKCPYQATDNRSTTSRRANTFSQSSHPGPSGITVFP
jgi:hypothetical protein